ncbi:Hsp70 family protein [Dactylosporangium sp. CS-047395]|uniref:Hsp70 family protein n=1 Tax=Dactylosporangium sp. CS-047395 TaxID=3239936 RepID=UPI003D8F72CC
MSGAVLAIDFGTTSSAATLTDGVRRVQLREPGSGVWTWPSAVFFDGRRPVVGTAAVSRRRLRPGGFRDELKRHLGQGTPLYLAERPLRTVDLVTLILQAIREEAERVHGARVGRAVITVPASYGPDDLRARDMLEAARNAGLPAAELVAEPVAAALAPVAGEPLPPGATVLVYDFGGGTFDAALVRLGAGDGSPHAVLGAAALDDCGGRELDAAVITHLRAAGGAALAGVLDAAEDADDEARLSAARDTMEFAEFARHLKHRVSAENAADDYFRAAGLVLRLDQQRLRMLAQPLLERTTDCCRRLLDDVRPGPVAAVVLVGGSSRLPGLTDHLARTLGLPVRQAEDVEVAVSQGAGVWASGGAVLTATAQAPRPDRQPLSWTLPAGPATVIEWLVGPGQRYTTGQVLGRVRAADGSLIDLAAAAPGRVQVQHAHQGDAVLTGDWIVTVDTTG